MLVVGSAAALEAGQASKTWTRKNGDGTWSIYVKNLTPRLLRITGIKIHDTQNVSRYNQGYHKLNVLLRPAGIPQATGEIYVIIPAVRGKCSFNTPTGIKSSKSRSSQLNY